MPTKNGEASGRVDQSTIVVNQLVVRFTDNQLLKATVRSVLKAAINRGDKVAICAIVEKYYPQSEWQSIIEQLSSK